MLRCVSFRAPFCTALCAFGAVLGFVGTGFVGSGASAQERDAAATSTLTWVYEHALALEARADVETAAELFEVYAEACLENPTADLEPDAPCAHSARALMRAFEFRQTLGDLDAAALDAATFRQHFLYAEPRRAIQIGVRLARMYIERGQTSAAILEIETLERAHGVSPGVRIVTLGLRAQLAERAGDKIREARTWRRVERIWQAGQATLARDGVVPGRWVRESVAAGRLSRAQPLVDRFLATRPPRLTRVRSDVTWWRRVSAWLTRSRRRLVMARHALEQVYELGSPEHSVAVAGLIGELYTRQMQVYESLELPHEELLFAIASGGQSRPGYEQARSHFETCLAWASHHTVADRWAQRCAQGLAELDPVLFPMQAELHGSAAHRTPSRALPPGLEE